MNPKKISEVKVYSRLCNRWKAYSLFVLANRNNIYKIKTVKLIAGIAKWINRSTHPLPLHWMLCIRLSYVTKLCVIHIFFRFGCCLYIKCFVCVCNDLWDAENIISTVTFFLKRKKCIDCNIGLLGITSVFLNYLHTEFVQQYKLTITSH